MRAQLVFRMDAADKTERLRQLDTDLLLALDALLREQNVTQAAKRLGLSQSAMSARLTRLRSVFQDRLFVNITTSRGVVATPYALSMRNALSTALAALESLIEPNADFDARASTKTFRLAMHDNPAALLAPSLVARKRIAAVCKSLVDRLGEQKLRAFVDGEDCEARSAAGYAQSDFGTLQDSLRRGRVELHADSLEKCYEDTRARGCAIQTERLPAS